MKNQVHCGLLNYGVTLMGVVILILLGLLSGGHFGVYALTEEESYNEVNGIHMKCSFFDTVNVTGYPSHRNGSYTYEGVLIPSHYVDTFDYIYKNRSLRIDVAPHTRACICKLKPCINTCCPWGFIFKSGGCKKYTNSSQLWPEPVLNITLGNRSVQNMNIFEQFVVQSFRPCKTMYALKPSEYEYDAYQLLDNGSLLQEDDMTYLDKNEFCLGPTTDNDTDLYYTINPLLCFLEKVPSTADTINKYAMLVSIPFMLLTIAVYLLIPKLRNQHGKSLICYLLGLTIGYSVLCFLWLDTNIEPFEPACAILGYIAYFAFMSAFLWMNVISIDLWHTFRGTRYINRLQKNKRFLFYSLYSWGTALVFFIFTLVVQEYSGWPKEFLPGIGGYSCWLNMTGWSVIIYFYGPILVIIVANTVMFVMTALKIRGVQREMSRITAGEDSTKNLRKEKDKFGLFLRLFLIMGVTWSAEIISHSLRNYENWYKVLFISDLCNALQGFIIFMVFVMKKKVRKLIAKRLLKHKTPSSRNLTSTNSASTDINSCINRNGKRPSAINKII